MYTQVCEICRKEFESKQPAVTCSDGCKQKRHRLKLAEKRGNVTPVTPVTSTPIERLYNEPVASNQILLEILAELKTLNARLATPTMTVNIPLGSGYVPNVALPDIEPPQVIFDEAAAKARSIANTLAAMADF